MSRDECSHTVHWPREPDEEAGQGAARTFSDPASDLQVRVIDALKGYDDEADQLLAQVELQHSPRLRAL